MESVYPNIIRPTLVDMTNNPYLYNFLKTFSFKINFDSKNPGKMPFNKISENTTNRIIGVSIYANIGINIP